MEILARLGTFALACALSACGTVTSDPTGGGGAGADAGPGVPGADAGVPLLERIVFTVPEEGGTRLYAADLVDGVLAPARLLSGETANAAAIVSDVSVSADGQAVLYRLDADAAGQPDLYLVRFDGDQPRPPVRVSDDHGDNYVVESFLAPDGSAAVYGAGTVGGGWVSIDQYFFVDLSGSAPAAPAALGTGGGAYGGALSGDGSRFAFIESRTAFAVSLASRPAAALRVGPAATGDQGVVSLALAPDGSAVALAGDLTTAGVNELYVADLSGPSPGPARRASRPLVAGGDVDPGVLAIPSHRFSPDGRHVAYLADARTDGVVELFIVDVSDGIPGAGSRVSGDLVAGGQVMVTFGVSPFSPDGRLVAYRADQVTDGVSELFVADVSGAAPTAARRVNGSMAAGGEVTTFRFAPDGSGIAYQADQRAADVLELFYADARGATPAPATRVNGDPVSGGDVSGAIAFSRDAGEIAFAGDLAVDARAEPYRAVIDDGAVAPAERVQATSSATSGIHSIAFSAGGALVFAGDTARTSCDLWIAARRGETLDEAQRVNLTTAREGGAIGFWVRP